MNKHLLPWLAGLALIPAGCTMAPKYERPAAPVPAEWPGGAAYTNQQTAGNAPTAPDLNWREFFTDVKLQRVISAALTNNRSLRIAVLNVKAARAEYGIQRAELSPTLDATASGTRQRVPADLLYTGESQSAPGLIESDYGVNAGVASWEVDFFGRIRSLKNEALENFLATEQGRRGAQLLLVSSVAEAYLTLAADRDHLTLAEVTLESQRSTYDMIQQRHRHGLVSALDLDQVEMQVDAARGEAASYTQSVAQDENALNLLLGSPAPGELLPAGLAGVTPPAEVSPGLSSEVLLRRPDVLQAEHQLKAANANIGAARADFFPRISLTAAIGTASSDLSGLFKSGSSSWSYGPQIVLPVFDARTWYAYQAVKVQREIALEQYQQAIQGAFKEVADALAAHGTVNLQVAAQQSEVNAAAEAYRLSVSRYNRGIDSYLTVLDSQRSLYAAQRGLISLQLAKLANQVNLYAVLGGGWQTGRPPGGIAADDPPPARRHD
jgi:multidrug efflux system outer membrane protein